MDPWVSVCKYGKFGLNDSCEHNELVAMIERVIYNPTPAGNGVPDGAYPPVDEAILPMLDSVYDDIARQFVAHTSHTPLTFDECLAAFKQTHGPESVFATQLDLLGFDNPQRDPLKYQRAYDFWKARYAEQDMSCFFIPDDATLKKAATVHNFSKVEYLSTAKHPRNIMAQSPEFNIVYAQLTKPMESYFNKHLSAMGSMRKYTTQKKERGVPNPWITAGMNKTKEGEVFRYKDDLFLKMHGVRPIKIGLDCSGWDAHLAYLIRLAEMRFIRRCFPGVDTDRITRHSVFIRMVCSTISAVIKGMRITGAMDTGLMNKITMIAFTLVAFKILGVRRFDIANKGDDEIIFVHPEDLDRVVDGFPKTFLRLGQQLKLETLSQNTFEIEYCQGRLVRVLDSEGEERWSWVSDPRKVFATLGSHIHCRTQEDAARYFGDVMYAYSILYPFVPLFRSLSTQRVLDVKRRRRVLMGLAQQVARVKVGEYRASPHTLSDYSVAFDIPVALLEAEVPDNQLQGLLWAWFRDPNPDLRTTA
jgi:hypothetical protein